MKRIDMSTILSVWVLFFLILAGCAEVNEERVKYGFIIGYQGESRNGSS